MNAQGNAKHQDAVAASHERTQQLRIDVRLQIARIAELVAQLDALASTRQSTSHRIAPPAVIEARGKSDALDRTAARTLRGIAPGQHPAPASIGAVSADAEITFALQSHIRRLAPAARLVALEAEQTEQEDQGLCSWPRRRLVLIKPTTEGPILQLLSDLANIVDTYTSRPGLHALLRDLQHLEEIALTVVDGRPAREQAPRPTCPWCGRDSLILINREDQRDVEIIRCIGDHWCHCDDLTCPCYQPDLRRRRRHEWARAAQRSVTWTRLSIAQDEYDALTDLEKAQKTHPAYDAYPYSDDCVYPTSHTTSWIPTIDGTAKVCTVCPSTGRYCSACSHNTGQPVPWPCPTITPHTSGAPL